MTRPGSGSPDQSANQDDAVWLDLVARLEAKSPGEGTEAAVPDTAVDSAADKPEKSATFRDFDPLGLAGRAPLEPSAAERHQAAEEDGAQDSQDGWTPGPRDYGVEDADGDFIPEEPPSLAGTDPLTVLAWVGAVGAPVALLLSVMFWRSAPLLAILGMAAAFLVAVVYLVMQLPQEKDENDDGARV